jgi:crossover junction endodeoxyribonuclease RuvC
MKIMGVDPGTIRMGVAVINGSSRTFDAPFYRTITLGQKKALHERLNTIFIKVCDLLDEWRPDVVALEDIFHGASFRSAIRIGEARAAVILAATQKGITVVEYPPARVKSAVCGSGRAAKVQVQNMVKNILGLQELPDVDAADAIAIALCHMHTIKNRS